MLSEHQSYSYIVQPVFLRAAAQLAVIFQPWLWVAAVQGL